jgi:hypothetical protein
MKKNLLLPLLLFVFLTACKDEEDAPEPQTRIDLEVSKQKLDSSGKVTVNRAPAIIHIWKAEDRDYDVEASSSDMYIGYAYDKVSGTHKTAEYGSVGSVAKEVVKPGRYFVYVLLMKSSSAGSLAYSYTTVDVKEGETLALKKVFSHDIGTEQYEEWDKNK